MAGLSLDHPWAFTFGILGNIISFMVYLAPVPTFYRVYRKKSTEGFQSVPYVVGLFSAMLWIYYALVKTNAALLITINIVGCIIETIYISMYLKYAPKSAKIFTAKLLFLMNIGMFGVILVLTLVLTKGSQRVLVLGWICVGFSVSVYVAPLSIIRLVLRTRSVEFMPFSLSFFLTLSAVLWFTYGYLSRDKYVAIPNILGFAFGAVQMVLYLVYKNARPLTIPVKQENKCAEHIVSITKLTTTPVADQVHPIKAAFTNCRKDQKEATKSEEAISPVEDSHEQGEDAGGKRREIVSGKEEVEMTNHLEV